MAGLHRTVSSLSRFRRVWETYQRGQPQQGTRRGDAPLGEVREFGPNPGLLRMLTYVPPSAAPAPALVVVLHGCKQSAAGYNEGSGWSHLADRHGFLLLFPEQQVENNPSTCFTWFEPGPWQRGPAEAASIREMIERMIGDHGVDPARVYVTGLSAGGAMANLLLATYPEVFAAGAVIAGLPYGAAADVPSAFEAMFQGSVRAPEEWGNLVRGASGHRGPWPRISVWHGTSDRTVLPVNGQEIVKQWTDVHGIPLSRPQPQTGEGFLREAWRDGQGRIAVEHVAIPGMAHGTPLSPGTSDGSCGAAGPFMLDVGVSSTHHIAHFFDLGAEPPLRASRETETQLNTRPSARIADRVSARGLASKERLPADIGGTITRALRAAGLLRSP